MMDWTESKQTRFLASLEHEQRGKLEDVKKSPLKELSQKTRHHVQSFGAPHHDVDGQRPPHP